MKIAVTGKGGSGKTTLAAGLSILFAQHEKKVIAVDCDPDMNLGLSLGFSEPEKITPISQMKDLIAERTQSGSSGSSGFFKLNPTVEDIPEKFCPELNNIRLIVMGKVTKAEGGCLCPENTFIKRLMSHLVIDKQDILIMDMVAGSEHLGRGTAKAVDAFLVMTEPTILAINTALNIKSLAKDLGVKNIFFIANKLTNKADIDFLKSGLQEDPLAGISFNSQIQGNRGKFEFDENLIKEFQNIYDLINRRIS